MKAVVLERKGNTCIVLADDGCVYRIHASFHAGDEIDVSRYLAREKRMKRTIQRTIAIASILVLALLGTFCYTTYDVSAAVTTEGDAPITYYVNHRGRVLSAEGQNEEGKRLLEGIDIKDRPPIDKALDRTEHMMREEGFLGEDENLKYERKPPPPKGGMKKPPGDEDAPPPPPPPKPKPSQPQDGEEQSE